MTECPICGGELQASVTFYLSNLTIDPETFEIQRAAAFNASETSEVTTDTSLADLTMDTLGEAAHFDAIRIYCENDHTSLQMYEALTKGGDK